MSTELARNENTTMTTVQDDTPWVQPATDLYRTDTAHFLVMDLPGTSAEDLSVNLEDNVLTVEATPQYPELPGEAQARGWRPVRYRRSLSLSQEIDADGIEAKLDQGTLTVTLPHAARLSRRIEIATA